jgi:VanZ family protein
MLLSGRGRDYSQDMVTASLSRLTGFAGAALLAAIVVATFVPAAWQVRLGLHWLLEHFLAYFTLTLVFSIATRRPITVAAVLLPVAIVLETLQALTADRVADAATALFAAAGVASAALLADLVMALGGKAASGPKA